MSGTAEEPLFRAFVMLVLARSWVGGLRIGRVEIGVAGVIAAAIFAYAHIGWQWYPFAVMHVNPLQLLTAFVVGLAYAAMFERTRSLLAPILAHNTVNVIVGLVGYLFVYVLAR